MKYFDSDTVSCIANLSNLTSREKTEIRRISKQEALKNGDEALKNSDVGTRLLHFIKSEKPYFLPKIELRHLNSVFAVRPKQTNRRILAQQGAFLIYGLKYSLEDLNDFDFSIFRTKVPTSAKKTILEELDDININESTLFPEIEKAAKYIMSKIPVAEEGSD